MERLMYRSISKKKIKSEVFMDFIIYDEQDIDYTEDFFGYRWVDPFDYIDDSDDSSCLCEGLDHLPELMLI